LTAVKKICFKFFIKGPASSCWIEYLVFYAGRLVKIPRNKS